MDVFLVRFPSGAEHVREKQVRRVGRVVRAGVRADEVAAKAAGRVVEEEARREVALGVHGVEQAQPRRIQHGPGAGEQPAHVGRQDGPVHELGPQAAVRRGEVAALAHGQLFSGDFHRAAQAGGHGRAARQDVERVPVRDVPREAGGQVRADGPAVHAFEPLGDTPQGRRERPLKGVVGILAGQRVPDGHEPIVSRQKEVLPLQKGRPLRHGLHERRGMLGHAGLFKD